MLSGVLSHMFTVGMLIVVDAVTMGQIGWAMAPTVIPFGFHNRFYSKRELSLPAGLPSDLLPFTMPSTSTTTTPPSLPPRTRPTTPYAPFVHVTKPRTAKPVDRGTHHTLPPNPYLPPGIFTPITPHPRTKSPYVTVPTRQPWVPYGYRTHRPVPYLPALPQRPPTIQQRPRVPLSSLALGSISHNQPHKTVNAKPEWQDRFFKSTTSEPSTEVQTTMVTTTTEEQTTFSKYPDYTLIPPTPPTRRVGKRSENDRIADLYKETAKALCTWMPQVFHKFKNICRELETNNIQPRSETDEHDPMKPIQSRENAPDLVAPMSRENLEKIEREYRSKIRFAEPEKSQSFRMRFPNPFRYFQR